MELERQRRRRHGLEWPYDPMQVAASALFCGAVANLFVLYTQLEPARQPQAMLVVGLSAAYIVLALLVWGIAVHCQLLDPRDPGLESHESQPSRYCHECECFVAQRSQHCYRCRKCVARFDHHCPWLNTCIGEANYRAFIALVTTLLLMITLHLALLAHACMIVFVHKSASADVLPRLGYGIALGASGTVFAVMWQQLSWLLCLHAMLNIKGYTTSEYFENVARKNEPPPRLCLMLCRRQCKRHSAPTRVAPGPRAV